MTRNLKALTLLFLLSGIVTAQEKQKAYVRIRMPAPGTELVIQGATLKVTDAEVRLFESPPLEADKAYVYDVKATWTENGKQFVRERTVKVMAGKTTEIDLRVGDDGSPDITPIPGKPADKPPVDHPPEKPPVDNPPEKPPVKKPADKPPVDKPIEKPPVDKPVEKPPVAKPMDKPPIDKPADKPPADKPPAKPAEPPAKPAETPMEPFVGTPFDVVDTMLKLAKVRDGDVVYVIGAGDGRVALIAAKAFSAKKAVGFESSGENVERAKVVTKSNKKVEIRQADLSKLSAADLAEATVVVVDTPAQKQLAEVSAILKKLKPDTRIVSHDLELKELPLVDSREQTVGALDHAIYLYVLK